MINSDEQQAAKFSGTEGLGPLLVGCAIFLVAPLTMCLAVLIWVFSDKTPNVVIFHVWLARLGVGFVSAVAIFNTVMAIQARKRCITNALPTAQAESARLIAIASVLLWAIAAVALLNTTESLRLMVD